ncbi:MAG: hypothetical protein IKB04_06985 [Clostridia bacterium]|nr:hypothetical protein [Clostridia bacterium]
MSKAIEAPWLAKENGMTKLVFEDDFESMDTIDVDNTGKEGYKWYTCRAFGASPMKPEDCKIDNSVLTLACENAIWNYGLCTFNPKTEVGFSFFKGVLEFRIRIPRPRTNDKEAGEKGVPAVWSFPPSKITDETLDWVEPDWMEYWGDGYWTLTVHHMKRAVKKGEVVYWISNANHRAPVSLNDGEWHTLTYLWDDGIIQGYIDGEPTVKVTYAPKELSPEPYLHKGEADDPYQPLEREPQALILGGSWCNPLEIDWIRVWQK